MQSVTKSLTSHLQELVRTAVRRNMAPPFDLHLTGSKGDHFHYQIDEKGQILPQEDMSPLRRQLRGLQLLPSSPNFARDARNGSWNRRSRLGTVGTIKRLIRGPAVTLALSAASAVFSCRERTRADRATVYRELRLFADRCLCSVTDSAGFFSSCASVLAGLKSSRS